MTGIRRERSEGAQYRSQYGTHSEERASERALGAAIASDPNGEGELATRAVGCPYRGAAVKSPRLAPERLQCNTSATLLARKGTRKEWEARGLESAGREGGGVATGSNG